MLNDVYCAADNGARTMLLQLDLSSAFDTIDMCTLLRRLRFTFAISGPALNWISSYLACRSQAIRLGHKQSPNISCEYGVPQGSVLGPLLFMSPISNVISSFGVSQTQYADDTQLYIELNDATSVSTLSDCFTAVNKSGQDRGHCHRHQRATTNGRFVRHNRPSVRQCQACD